MQRSPFSLNVAKVLLQCRLLVKPLVLFGCRARTELTMLLFSLLPVWKATLTAGTLRRLCGLDSKLTGTISCAFSCGLLWLSFCVIPEYRLTYSPLICFRNSVQSNQHISLMYFFLSVEGFCDERYVPTCRISCPLQMMDLFCQIFIIPYELSSWRNA